MLRNSWLLALFALFALSSAFNLDGVEEYIHNGIKRQASGTGNNNSPTSAPPPASSAPPPSSAPAPSSTPAPSATPGPTSEPASSAAPAPSSAASQAPPASSTPGQPASSQRSSNAPQPSSTPASSAAPTTPVVRTTPLVSTSVRTFTSTSRTTLPNGQETDVTVSGVESVPITTGSATYIDAPTSQPNSESSGGLSDSNKKVIGGVVGGVGGALLLGGIALVFWRLRKRQNKVTADDDDLNLNTGAALGDKPNNGTGASPFQSNLEQYHNPGGRPNAAANF